MVKVASFTGLGKKLDQPVELPAEIFGLEPKNTNLMNQAYRAYLANGRISGSHSLKRGEVRGGGKKPWRQKGTGRARVGSSRVPLWRGGGVIFGPTGQANYTIKLPNHAKRLALRQALSSKAAAGGVNIIEDFQIKAGKVREALDIFKGISLKKRTLMVIPDKTPNIDRATRNLANLEVVQSSYLNIFRIINADLIIITTPALKEIKHWLGSSE